MAWRRTELSTSSTRRFLDGITFDISATSRQRFEEAIEKANSYDEKINEAYERGKEENDKSS